jgi:O-antigen ligase
MTSVLAFSIWLVCLIALLIWDPARDPKVSIAVWLPVIWMFFAGSRLPSQWLGLTSGGLEEGNPLDRVISLALIVLSLWILSTRPINWRGILQRNPALAAYILFTLISAIWSDFPLICLKRWFRDLGGYLVVLIALTDHDPLEAICTVLRRTSYLLIPLSVLLDKYFPNLSRFFDPWTGIGTFAGVTTGKNLLGCIALISGLFFVWDTAVRWPERRRRRAKRILVVNAVFLVMNLSLLKVANSATCRVCFGLGCLVILIANSQFFRRRLVFLKTLVPSIFCLFVLADFGLGLSAKMAQALGKAPTLTDRTAIWAFLLNMHTNPVIGTGYESFWLGPRLDYFWQNAGLGPLNEAHNGFLEVYLQLGFIGLLIVVWILLASYAHICRRLTLHQSIASLGLCMWLVMLFFSVTEAGFRMGMLWTVFLMLGIVVPKRHEKQLVGAKSFGFMDARPSYVESTESPVASRWGAASNHYAAGWPPSA